MAYILREDGERFVIPSYRDTIVAKGSSLLKKEILLLTENYGEYITLQKKSPTQYEIAFSPEPGTLLGETVWHHFQRPNNLIYCEALPNKTEAILVIVKSGSVYLDGQFPIDSIADELIIFKTEQNKFDIYIYGDIPISDTEEEGKLFFDASTINKFTVLNTPVFPTLPTIKAFQLQLVDTVLATHGIGVLPIKPIIIGISLLALLWFGWKYLTSPKLEQLSPTSNTGFIPSVTTSPYQDYITALTSPDPTQEINSILKIIATYYSMPGWVPLSVTYEQKADINKYGQVQLVTTVKSKGARTDVLFSWAKSKRIDVNLTGEGFFLTQTLYFEKRSPPKYIYKSIDVLANLIDRLSYVLPDAALNISAPTSKPQAAYTERDVTVSFNDITLTTLGLINKQFDQLPVVLTKMSLGLSGGNLSGTISFKLLGK